MSVAKITKLGLVAAAYVGLTIAFSFISYGEIQFRIAEMLVLLVFFKKDYALPLILGCAIANLASPQMLFDVVFGTVGTIFAVLGILLVSRYQKAFGEPWIALFVASLCPVVANGLFVGWELELAYGLPFFATALSVAFGELVVVSIVGVPVFLALSRNHAFMALIDPDVRSGASGDVE
ncbi:MAG: QueT transporter family protein [Bacillota bacterium]|nr:QueT transporter family protein [Bacillota bacterium]